MRSVLPDLSELAAVAAYAPHLAHAFASLACDLALVLGRDGVITQLALSPNSQLALFTAGWVGRPLMDVVTPGSRHKITSLLQDVADTGLARRREVNLPPLISGEGADVPMAYTALRLGPEGPVLATGHDLRAVALMQQRFIRVQQELERSYGRAQAAAAEAAGGPAEQLNEASRLAFAAWLRAERLAVDGPAPRPRPARAVRRKRR